MGLEAEQVSEPADFTAALERAFASKKPTLIEVAIEGKA
ncbi:MAG: hypothetical protein ACKVH0_17940 [Alphaproteobacteria bacterium]